MYNRVSYNYRDYKVCIGLYIYMRGITIGILRYILGYISILGLYMFMCFSIIGAIF